MIFLFCFFKQKTAYEMRISDWSSDVCSSDLARSQNPIGWQRSLRVLTPPFRREMSRSARNLLCARFPGFSRFCVVRSMRSPPNSSDGEAPALEWIFPAIRSEEHTSELQSLMRISYAVFCLKKKIKIMQ